MHTRPTPFAHKILAFNTGLALDNGTLPDDIEAMNPFRGENAALINRITAAFYTKFYSDNETRSIIFGINPGRLGAGLTGVPFTDTKRLSADCGIEATEIKSHEPSSVFVYEVIRAWGSVADFYRHFYISSLCPLGFVRPGEKGGMINYNYYDQRDLQEAVTPFIIDSVDQQLAFGVHTNRAYCMGKGKNFKFFEKLNKQQKWFDEIIPLDHPRFVVQYRSKHMAEYVETYLRELGKQV